MVLFSASFLLGYGKLLRLASENGRITPCLSSVCLVDFETETGKWMWKVVQYSQKGLFIVLHSCVQLHLFFLLKLTHGSWWSQSLYCKKKNQNPGRCRHFVSVFMMSVHSSVFVGHALTNSQNQHASWFYQTFGVVLTSTLFNFGGLQWKWLYELKVILKPHCLHCRWLLSAFYSTC